MMIQGHVPHIIRRVSVQKGHILYYPARDSFHRKESKCEKCWKYLPSLVDKGLLAILKSDMYDTIGMRSPVINKIAFVGILAALLIAVPMSMTMFDEQALFADLYDIFSLAALAGGFLAIVIGSARMCGRCGGDLPMEKSAGCIIAMAGLVFFYPYLADFWGMPYSMTVMMFGIAFLLFFAAIADALAAYTNRLPELKRFFIAVAVVMFVLTALSLIRMEYDFIDFSGDLGWYVDLFTIIVAAVYIACSSYAAGYGYEVDAPRGS